MGFEGGSQHTLRKYLLGTASGAALIGGAPLAYADTNIDHVYLDVSGQYSLTGGHTNWADFFHGFDEPQIKTKNGWDMRGDLALQSGNWYLTLSANYGKTGTSKANLGKYGQTAFYSHTAGAFEYFTAFHRDGTAKHDESHLYVDFTLGKDVGLGMFGMDGSSIVSLGVRYAHFIARTREHMFYATYRQKRSTAGLEPIISHHYYFTTFNRKIDRQFVGWGPVITWKGKCPFDPEFSLAWGLSAAAVVGGRSFEDPVDGKFRHREIVSPQVGGYLGVNWQMPDSPLDFTVGYRGDAYFDIVDKGFSSTHYGDRISHGPYAQIGWQLE